MKKITVTILGLLLCLIMLEIGVRIVGFVFLSLQERRNIIAIRQRGSYRILCLGDSMTARMWPRPLEGILNKKTQGIKFTVIDKAQPATNSDFVVSTLNKNLDRYNPNMVVVMMGFNDEGGVLPYGNIPISEKIPFKVYRLVRILWYHIVNKARDGTDNLRQPHSFDEQDKVLKRRLKINPASNLAYAASKEYSKNQGKYDKDEEILKKAIEINSENDEAYAAGLGGHYRRQEKYDKAAEMFKKTIELNPENDEAYFRLGWWYMTQREYDKAEEILKKAIEINPKNDLAYAGLGWCYKQQGEYDKAEEMFKKAIEINPKNDRAYRSLSLHYGREGRYGLAEEYFRKADRLWSEYYNPVTHHNYQKLRKIVTQREIRLVCLQYPVRSVVPLKKMLEPIEGIIFVDNERIFKEALEEASHDEYFVDMFGGDFGHCTPKGNRLLAENIANVILRECFNR